MPNDDGSFTMFFGYMNSNWLEEFDIPIGPDNASSRAAPIRDSPRISIRGAIRSSSRSACRRTSATKELIWTLTTNGKTERAYASLKSDYQIDKQVISTEVGGDFGSLRDELRTNMPPEARGGRRRSGAR